MTDPSINDTMSGTDGLLDEVYEETVVEVAKDLDLDERALRAAFRHWLGAPGCIHPGLQRDYTLACYAVYRVTKLKHAARTSLAGWQRWRERAKAAGWTEASGV